MTRPVRLRALFFLIAILVALMALSVGIKGLEFKPGTPFTLLTEERTPFNGGYESIGTQPVVAMLRVMLALILVLLPVYIVYSLWTPRGRRRLLSQLLLLAAAFLLQNVVINVGREVAAREQPAPIEPGAAPEPIPLSQAQEFIESVSPWLMALVTIALVVLVTLLVVSLLRFFFGERVDERTRSLERLGNQAQQAVDALQSGKDLKDTVIRCYFQMSELLAKERGIERGQAATPREFEARLIGMGLPSEPVRTLTRVFEEVRYGSITAGQKQEYMAVQSLVAIVQYCRGEV